MAITDGGLVVGSEVMVNLDIDLFSICGQVRPTLKRRCVLSTAAVGAAVPQPANAGSIETVARAEIIRSGQLFQILGNESRGSITGRTLSQAVAPAFG